MAKMTTRQLIKLFMDKIMTKDDKKLSIRNISFSETGRFSWGAGFEQVPKLGESSKKPHTTSN